jgi:MFS-type transporter involved in bile tolerance (Atg22 family)
MSSVDVSDRPLWFVFLGTALLIVIAVEVGYRLGANVRRRTDKEKESSVSAVSGSVLALLAFMLAITFGVVADRYESRKSLVREQAITISTAFARTDVLSEPDRANAKSLFRTYMTVLLAAADPDNSDQLPDLITQLNSINTQLWDMGMAQARTDPHSELFGLYLDSLNSVGDVQALRVAIAVQAKLPEGLWVALFVLVAMAMVAVGYQAAIAESRRTWTVLLLAFSFATVIALIAVLDNPERGYLPVSQQPLIDVQTSMNAATSP